MFLPNFDTLAFTALTDQYNQSIQQYIDYLITEQDRAKLKNEDIIVTLGSKSFQLLPNGSRQHRFILHNDDIEFKLQQFHNPNSSNFPIYIKIKSAYLWERRDQAYYDIIEYLESILGPLQEAKLSRIDLCCHTTEIDTEHMKVENFLTRSKSHKIYMFDNKAQHEVENTIYYHHKRPTGFVFGKSPIMCRIYDKSLEIKQASKKTWFYKIWGLEEEKRVFNIEFQLSRDFLKAYGINTYEHFMREVKSIWIYLTSEWLVYKNIDHTRLENCTTNETWIQLQESYNSFADGQGIERQEKRDSEEKYLINMISCYMMNHAAIINQSNYIEYLKLLIDKVDTHLQVKELDFYEEVEKKRLLLKG